MQLGSIATVENRTVPRSLNRFQQLNAVKLSGVTVQTLDDALAFLEAEAAKIVPASYSLDYTGESRQLRLEGNKFLPAFMLAVVLIYLTLAAQFNSFRDPFVILAGSVPLAMFGALVFTFLKMPNPEMAYWTNPFTTTLNIYSQVGLVTLIGLVAKNGILVVEFAKQMQQKGLHKLAAIRSAARTRLRPILMTTVATVAGHFPLVLVSGAGAEARNSIGLVLVGGMAIGTMFTLFVIPSVYNAARPRPRRHALDKLPEEDAEALERPPETAGADSGGGGPGSGGSGSGVRPADRRAPGGAAPSPSARGGSGCARGRATVRRHRGPRPGRGSPPRPDRSGSSRGAAERDHTSIAPPRAAPPSGGRRRAGTRPGGARYCWRVMNSNSPP